MAGPIACPLCGRTQHHANARCLGCGEPLASNTAKPRLSNAARRALAIGFALAVVLTLIPFTRILFFPLITIVHELGHAATAWMFGYPAIPAFDFGEGGGMTMTRDRVPLLLLIPYGLLAAALWKARHDVPTVIALLVVAAVYSRLAFTNSHNALILAMGHGAELLMALVFLHRAMAGTTLLQADERPAYAMCAFLILIHDVQFAWTISRSTEAQAAYAEGKSSVENDWIVLAADHVNISVPGIARIFLLACLAGPVIPWLLYRHESTMAEWWMRVTAGVEEP
ncbi:MAG: hypothetical protein JWM95_4816 [Gemmatimonadetes bacterium]|nr:hypothetical protein [Gemmatimonadota bacterium]